MAAFFSGKLQRRRSHRGTPDRPGNELGTPVVRETLITPKHQGFVRRISNKASDVTSFEPEEVKQVYMLPIELETLTPQGARARH